MWTRRGIRVRRKDGNDGSNSKFEYQKHRSDIWTSRKTKVRRNTINDGRNNKKEVFNVFRGWCKELY